MRYRRDIDGLRALAVLPVVLFHAGFSWFPGGYVGVDVFFVISGFLITSLILNEITKGRFSVASFYERRIRRIFPALFTVLVFSAAIATWLFLPDLLASFAKSLIATASFLSNHFFYREIGYFAAPADTKPLLHTWSLAVEEQFYIVFPIFMVLACRWGGRRWLYIVAAGFAASLALSIWMTETNPAGAFYLAPGRAWELLLGSMLAAGALPKIGTQWLREALAISGVALIAYAVFCFSASRPFPGPAALIPCLGTAFFLYAGDDGSSITARILSVQPIVFVGLISYSLYLWHWPLLAFARYWFFEGLAPIQLTSIILASFVLATLSWKFVEQPFRMRRVAVGRRSMFSVAATGIAVTLAFGVMTERSGGWPSRLSAEAQAILSTASKKSATKGLDRCTMRGMEWNCTLDAPTYSHFAVWGDSHAARMRIAIDEAAKRHGETVDYFVRAGCTPVPGFERGDRDCGRRNAAVLGTLIASPDIHTIVLISRFATYLYDSRKSVGGTDQSLTITATGQPNLDAQSLRILFAKKLRESVEALVAAGKRVVIVYPVPEIGYQVPQAAQRYLFMHRDLDTLKGPSPEAYRERQAGVFAMLDGLGNLNAIVRLYPHRRLCDAQKCRVYANGSLLYLDDDHLSDAGARYLAPDLDSIFERVSVVRGDNTNN